MVKEFRLDSGDNENYCVLRLVIERGVKVYFINLFLSFLLGREVYGIKEELFLENIWRYRFVSLRNDCGNYLDFFLEKNLYLGVRSVVS